MGPDPSEFLSSPVRVLPDGGERRIRTSEGERQQIYSLPPLAAWVSPLIVWGDQWAKHPRHGAGEGI